MVTDAQSEALYNYAREFHHCDVVVDPLAGQEWRDCLQDLADGEVVQVSLDHEFFGKNSDQAPAILRVPLAQFDVLDALAGIAREQATDPTRQTRSVCGFIRSERPLADVARELAGPLSLRVGRQRRYFRYFDPRVMHHLPALIATDRLGLRGIAAWGYFTWEGEWAVQELSADSNGRMPGTAVRLTGEEWRPFAAIEHFNATVAAFLGAGLSWPCRETERLRKTVMATLELGITEPEDVATYLLRSRRLGFPIAQHPQWNNALDLLAKGVPLADALDGIGLAVPASN